MFDISSIAAYSKLDNKGSQTTDHVPYVCENSNLYTTVMIHNIFLIFTPLKRGSIHNTIIYDRERKM
jgi:hypothetical protein